MSEFIGAIIGATSGTIYAVINPGFDTELDNPRWLLLQGGPPKLQPVDPARYILTDDTATPTQFYEVAPDQPLSTEPMRLVRIPRGEYMGAMTMAQLAELVRKISG